MESIFETRDPKKKILLRLIKHEGSTARQLAQETGIPRNKVYGYLKDLISQNLVYAAPTTKGKYRTETLYLIRKPEVLNLLSQWRKSLEQRISECNFFKKTSYRVKIKPSPVPT